MIRYVQPKLVPKYGGPWFFGACQAHIKALVLIRIRMAEPENQGFRQQLTNWYGQMVWYGHTMMRKTSPIDLLHTRRIPRFWGATRPKRVQSAPCKRRNRTWSNLVQASRPFSPRLKLHLVVGVSQKTHGPTNNYFYGFFGIITITPRTSWIMLAI